MPGRGALPFNQRRTEKLVLELLTSRGMIWRSEKRRLLGAEASVTRISVLSSWSAKGRLMVSSTTQVFRLSIRLSNRYPECSRVGKSVVPLLNPF